MFIGCQHGYRHLAAKIHRSSAAECVKI